MASIISAGTTSGTALNMAGDTSGQLQLATNGSTTAVTIDTSQNVGIGTSSPAYRLDTAGVTRSQVQSGATNNTAPTAFVVANKTTGAHAAGLGASIQFEYTNSGGAYSGGQISSVGGADPFTADLRFFPRNYGFAEAMRINSDGNVLVGTVIYNDNTKGILLGTNGRLYAIADGASPFHVNRLTNDGTLVEFKQDNALEGNISVSGTTVSYNGGHLSRWSQWQNEIGKPNVYRGSVLESVNDMCEWEKDGEPLPNEQATKTIVSTTVASKAVAGVFDRYDEDDENNPYDFYVAQSGDFVIRIAQGVTVQNGDLLESAGDGTAKPQADDICRSSTIAKVTSNYVSATYEDGSYCVPCILMIG